MITVSEAYKSAICASVREMKSQVEIGNHTIDSGIDELKIIENGSASSAISMGAALSNQLDIKLRCPDISVSFETEPINVYEGIKVDGAYELIPLGRFYPKTVDTPDEYKTVTIKAFDALGRAEADEVYEPGITFPADVNDVLDDLCAILGIEHQVVLPVRELPGIIEGSTVKQNLGWLAGIFGYNARMNKQGILVFDWYTDNSIEVSRNVQYQEGYTRKGNAIAIQAVTSGINENIFTSGAGQGIVFENPYITADEVQAIYNRIVGTVFQPCQVKWRGNPAAEITDILSVETSAGVYCKIFVSNQILDCCGGFSADSACERSEANSSVTFGNSPTDLKIKQSYTLLQQALKAYANLINGAVGGIFRVTDGNNDGINDGWLITSTEEYPLPADAKCILANSAGIGLSADGGKTYKTAVSFDGIAGEFLIGKIIVGEQLQIVDENGNDLFSVMKDEIKLQVIKECATAEALVTVETKADNAQSTADDALESAENNAKDMATIVTSFNADVENLQTQIDGSITTWFYEVEPTDSNEPAVNWTTTDLKNNHLGDLYYDTITGYCYRYQVQNNSYSWQRITDTDVTKALSDAQAAQDTADQKRRVFYTQPTPPYDAGDLWVQGSGGDILRCKTAKTISQSYAAADWVKASKYTDDTVAELAQATIDKYLSQTELIVGTQTAATGSWTGQASFSELINNMQIAYWLPYAGSGNASLNLTLADGTTTGAIPCYYSGTSRLTTHYGAGNVIRFVYRENVTIDSTIIEKGFWADANYNTDSNTYDRIRFSNSIKAKSAIAAGKIIVGDSSGYFPLAASTAFDITNPPLYAGSAIAASVTGTNNYLSYPSVNLRTTLSGFTGTAYKTVYVVGTLNGKTFTPNATLITSTEPTSEDGLTYIALGYLVSTYQIYLYPEHPMYRYYDGGFKTINQIAYEAFVSINSLNVGSRNLLKLSNPNISSGTYNIAKFYFGDSPPLADEEVTVSLKGTLGSGKVRWGLYNSGGTVNCTNLTADDLDDDGVYRKTFTWKVGSAANTFLSIYAMLHSVSATSSIEWIKLERGNKATDWSPAPEDQVGKTNVIASINASEEGVAISGKKISLDGFVKVTNSAEGDDVTNQISMLPGTTYTPPEYEWDTNVVIMTEHIYNGEKKIAFVLDDDGNIALLNGGSVYVIDDYIHTPIMIENASHDSGTYIRAYQICTPQLILGDVGDVGDKISALSTVTKSGYFAKVGNLAMANVYGASTSALPTVPSGYRPSYIVSCPATIILNGNAYMGYVTINTSGVITPYYYDYGSAPKSPVTGCTVYFLATWIIA